MMCVILQPASPHSVMFSATFSPDVQIRVWIRPFIRICISIFLFVFLSVHSHVCLSVCLTKTNPAVKVLTAALFFFFHTLTAFHRRIHRRHPAQVWGEQEHHGEPPEQGGVRESRLQTRCGAISALMMALYVFLGTVLSGAPSPAAHRRDSLEKSKFYFFKFIFKRRWTVPLGHVAIVFTVSRGEASTFFVLEMRIHRKEERLWSVCHLTFTTQHHLSML